MKKAILIILFFTSINFAHRQHVHQYITIEAYNLLKLTIGYDIPTLLSRLGGTSSWFVGDRPWQRGCITTGAWREDEGDIVAYDWDLDGHYDHVGVLVDKTPSLAND